MITAAEGLRHLPSQGQTRTFSTNAGAYISLWEKKPARPQKHHQTCSLHRTGTSLVAFCRGLPGVSPHGFGWLPVKIPWEILPQCLDVGGAKPGSEHLHEGSDRELVGPYLSLSSLVPNSAVPGSFIQFPRTERKTSEKQSLGEKPAEEQNLFAFREVFSRG